MMIVGRFATLVLFDKGCDGLCRTASKVFWALAEDLLQAVTAFCLCQRSVNPFVFE